MVCIGARVYSQSIHVINWQAPFVNHSAKESGRWANRWRWFLALFRYQFPLPSICWELRLTTPAGPHIVRYPAGEKNPSPGEADREKKKPLKISIILPIIVSLKKIKRIKRRNNIVSSRCVYNKSIHFWRTGKLWILLKKNPTCKSVDEQWGPMDVEEINHWQDQTICIYCVNSRYCCCCCCCTLLSTFSCPFFLLLNYFSSLTLLVNDVYFLSFKGDKSSIFILPSWTVFLS